MNIAILLKSAPCTDESDRAVQAAADMLAQGHRVALFLLQEAVRFCRSPLKRPGSRDIREITGPNLEIHVLVQDARLRGIEASAVSGAFTEGTYDSLVDLMESCDRVMGVL